MPPQRQNGGLSAGERIARLEGALLRCKDNSWEERREMKEKLQKLEIELAKTKTRLALMLAVVTVAGQALVKILWG